MESIKEARNCLDILRGTVIKGQISESLLLEIRNLSKKPKNPNEILQTLRLQLEQSLRERRSLFIETSLLRKQMESQKLEGLDYLGLKKIIREIVENEIKSKKNIDASLSSSFNFNNL